MTRAPPDRVPTCGWICPYRASAPIWPMRLDMPRTAPPLPPDPGLCRRRYPCDLVRGHRRSIITAALAALAAACALGLSACANTLQNEPLEPSFLESLVLESEFPVYWLGSNFHGLPLIAVKHDPAGADELQYGNCTQGGENVCVTPLELVTSPDNSFLPVGELPRRTIALRGVRAVALQKGRTIVMRTGRVVVDIYANSRALARAAAQAMVTINTPQQPGARLARALPDTGFAEKPLLNQQPPVAPLVHGPVGLPSSDGGS